MPLNPIAGVVTTTLFCEIINITYKSTIPLRQGIPGAAEVRSTSDDYYMYHVTTNFTQSYHAPCLSLVPEAGSLLQAEEHATYRRAERRTDAGRGAGRHEVALLFIGAEILEQLRKYSNHCREQNSKRTGIARHGMWRPRT